MSGLRRSSRSSTRKKCAIPQEDVEAAKGPSQRRPSQTNAVLAFAAASASSSFSAPPGGGHNHRHPVFLARVILRKVFLILATSDEEDVNRPGGILSLLKDVIVGVIMGLILISIAILLDHRDIVPIRSARNNFAVSQLLNDAETIANVEEFSDLKLMTPAEYESKRGKIDKLAEQKAKHQEALERHLSEVESKRREIDSIRKEYDDVMSDPSLELDKFCGECVWAGKVTCDGRVEFLKVTYNMRPIEGRIIAMQVSTCKKQK